MKTAFVTGGTGFVGGHLVDRLREEGGRVDALSRPESRAGARTDAGAEIAEGDVTDAASVRAAIPRGAHAAFHLAVSTNLWRRENALQDRVNIEGTRNVVAAARAVGVGRLVHVSSIAAWGPANGVISAEREQRGAASWINYCRTKALAEEAVRDGLANGLDAVIVSPSHVLGPRDRQNWSRIIRWVAEDRLPGVPPGGGSFCDVRDAAEALVRAHGKGQSGFNYLLGGPEASYLELVRMIARELGKPEPRRANPAWLLRIVAGLADLASRLNGRMPQLTPEGAVMTSVHNTVDDEPARSELGYRHRPLGESVRDTVDWLRETGEIRAGNGATAR